MLFSYISLSNLRRFIVTDILLSLIHDISLSLSFISLYRVSHLWQSIGSLSIAIFSFSHLSHPWQPIVSLSSMKIYCLSNISFTSRLSHPWQSNVSLIHDNLSSLSSMTIYRLSNISLASHFSHPWQSIVSLMYDNLSSLSPHKVFACMTMQMSDLCCISGLEVLITALQPNLY